MSGNWQTKGYSGLVNFDLYPKRCHLFVSLDFFLFLSFRLPISMQAFRRLIIISFLGTGFVGYHFISGVLLLIYYSVGLLSVSYILSLLFHMAMNNLWVTPALGVVKNQHSRNNRSWYSP